MGVIGSQQQRAFVVVGSCRESLGAIGSHWESLGAVGVNFPTNHLMAKRMLLASPVLNSWELTPEGLRLRLIELNPASPSSW